MNTSRYLLNSAFLPLFRFLPFSWPHLDFSINIPFSPSFSNHPEWGRSILNVSMSKHNSRVLQSDGRAGGSSANYLRKESKQKRTARPFTYFLKSFWRLSTSRRWDVKVDPRVRILVAIFGLIHPITLFVSEQTEIRSSLREQSMCTNMSLLTLWLSLGFPDILICFRTIVLFNISNHNGSPWAHKAPPKSRNIPNRSIPPWSTPKTTNCS